LKLIAYQLVKYCKLLFFLFLNKTSLFFFKSINSKRLLLQRTTSREILPYLIYFLIKKIRKMLQELTDDNFRGIIEQNEKLVMVYFWAEWNGRCSLINSYIKELANEYEGKAIICRMDTDSYEMLYMMNNIDSRFPTCLFFRDDMVVHREVGAMIKSTLTQKLDELIA